jgi:hypothetical protein
MPRSWDTRQDEQARQRAADEPNIQALHDALARTGTWTIDDILVELGGRGRDKTHRLAEKMLEARGLDITKKSIESQQRSINRWLKAERGEPGQTRRPNKDMQAILNRIGKNAQMARDGFDIAMSGDIMVSGYRRSNRSANIHMQGEAATAFLENPTYAAIGEAYTGSPDFAGYGADLYIDIISE